jgi:hypothetical protein
MSFGIPSDEIEVTLAKTDKVMDEALILLQRANVLLQDLQSMTSAVKVAIAKVAIVDERVN